MHAVPLPLCLAFRTTARCDPPHFHSPACPAPSQPFLAACRAALDHPNVALPLRLSGTAGLRDVLFWSSQQAMQNTSRPLADLAAATTQQLSAALAGVGLSATEVRAA